MSISLTESAVNEIRRLQNSRQQEQADFRIRIEPGGCREFYYVLSFTVDRQPSDRHDEIQGVSIVVDPDSAAYLEDLKVDFAEDLMGGAFRFENPNVVIACSCGQSFSIKSDPQIS